jgi:ribosomal protein S18 acetylase RimI-like enzyme
MDIRLRPLREDEFPDFLERQRIEYVRSMVEEAGMSRAAAAEKASADHASLFPGRAQQPNQRIYVLEDDATGERAGHLFWAERQPPGARATRAFVYDLWIEEPFRRRGLGRRALKLLEAQVRDEGLPGIDLNVWGGNSAARALYRAAGFDERAVFMSKELE